MHQRTSSSRSRPPRKEKIYRNSKEDLDKVRPVTLLGNGNSFHRSLSEFVKPGGGSGGGGGGGGGGVSSGSGRRDSVGNDKSRSHSRDREDNINFVRKRHEESLWWSTSHDLKECERSEKTYCNHNNLKDKRMDYGHGFIDDNRLSKLINRLQREDDYDRRILASKQLKDFLLQNENWKSVNKNAEKLLNILEGLLMDKASSEVKRQLVINMGIIGYAETLESQSYRYFDWVFNKYSTASSDEMRIHMLNCIVETLKTDGNKHKMDEIMISLMNNVQTVLENAEVPQVLIAIVDVILQIANKYPQVFGQHFRDTVDILVGWHIDTAQSGFLTQYTSDALVSFNRYWVSDMSFSTTLLGQFLEDMEAYSEELNAASLSFSVDEDSEKLIGCAAKIASLIKVYTTVVLSLGDYYDPDKTNVITYEFISEHALRMLKSAIVSADSLPTESMLIAVNDNIALQLSFLKLQSCPLVSSVMTFLDKQSNLQRPHSVVHLVSLLNLLNTMVREVNDQLPLPCLEQILGTISSFSKLRFHSSRQIRQQCLLLYRTVFTFKSVPLLEEAYRLVVGEIHSAFHTILKWDLSLPRADHHFDQQAEAEAIIAFSLCTLAELGNAKSSLLGMWALEPSIFELLSQRLRPTDQVLADKFPAIHYAVLFTLYSHCSRYGNFLLSSCLLNAASPTSVGDQPLAAAMAVRTTTGSESMTTSAHFETVITILNKTLSLSSSSFSVRSLCLKWSRDIIANAQPFLQTICGTCSFLTFIQIIISTAYSNDKHMSKAACSCLILLFRRPYQLKPVILNKCFEVCLLKITDINSCVREMFLRLLCHLPLDVATSQPKSTGSLNFRSQLRGNQAERITNLDIAWIARRHFMSRNPLVTFHSHNFRSVMAFILQGVPLDDSKLVQMFHTCQRIEKLKIDDIEINEITMNNEALLWFWATWEAAHFCILTKLRTSFGKPQETFTCIEGSVKSLLLETKLLNCDEASPEQKIDFEAISKTHLRAKLLLDFIEHLEKLMYNAYEGCTSCLPGTPKAVKTFFRTNKATCLEWLTRIRMAVLLLALHMGNPAMAVRQGYQLLSDMKDMSATRGAEFERVVMNVVHALIDLHCPDAILGLYVWCKETIGRKFTWMKAAIEQASRRYETAAHEFVCLIKKHENTVGKANRASPIASPTPDDENKMKLCAAKSHSAHSENQDEPDLPVLTFMSNQVVECYRRLNNWADLVKWVVSQQQISHEQNGSVTNPRFETSADLSYLTTLTKFEELDASALKMDSFVHNAKSDETLQKLMIPFPQRVLQEADSALMSAALKWDSSGKSSDSRKKIGQYLSNACQCTVSAVRVAAMDWPIVLPSEHVAFYQTTVALMSCLVKEKKNYTLPLSSNFELDLISSDCGTWNQAIRWSKYIEFVNSNNNEHDALDNLHLTVSRLARKHRNLKLSQKLLVQHMKRNVDFDWRSIQNSLESRNNNNLMWEVLKQTQSAESSVAISLIQREGAKLLHSLGHPQQAVDVLLHMIRSSIDAKNDSADNNLNARSLLTLVKWMQADGSLFSDGVRKLIALVTAQDESHKLDKCFSLKYLAEAETMNGDSDDESQSTNGCINESSIAMSMSMSMASPTLLVPEREGAFGRMLYLSTLQSPFLAKSWSCFASWLYKWGRKAVDVASEKSVDLSPEEWNRLLSLLPKDTPENEIDAIRQILSRTYSVPETEFMDSYCDGVETIRRQLAAVSPRLSNSSLDGLVAVWKGVVDRIYSFYKLSAEAYFKCLNLNETMNTNEQCEDGNIIATLRLLRLVVKHASELRQVLEEGLANTPTGPWKGIIPQLFARLNHPESYVRQSISDLLCRVAHAAPHLIVFPAVVGSTATHREIKDGIGLLGQYLSQASDDGDGDGLEDRAEDISPDGDVTPVVSLSEEDEQKEMLMRNCFAAMVETLAKQDPRTISEVKTLVHELRRITLLWDELWLGTLNQYHADFNRKILQLDSEVKKVTSNPALTNDEKRVIILKKHTTILKPTLFVLEQLDQITSQLPETPHERWFQDTFQKLIEDTISRLHNPVNPAVPQASWQLYKQLVHALQHRAQKRSSLALNMETVSPVLATLRSTVVCMPGAQMKGDQIVTIDYIDNSIAILPTKTKPKKLIFHGTDGRKYVYLFKGLEDLHLDERIMQFISIINSMFVRNRRQGKFVYHARHYSVTPLGPRSGLIQWVDGATPLFGLYKRWQQREAAALALKSTGTSGNPSIAASTMRPSEIYYNKLTPLLKEKGIVNLDVRKDWPISVLRQVLLELMEETPRDLLAKELWCSSSTAMEWWKTTETYSQSTAVMSMIGYIIGLGDRHLDNVLVDLATGEVVHIDYNVCFEKGRNLRVPEKVPFRMTPNIESALGVTGAEGIFRVSCEQVLKTMRRGRETLLTLLEAFVYDPLIDWTPGGEGGYTGAVYGGGQLVGMETRQSKLDMEQEITYSMFSIRITEMKAEWSKNKEELLESLPVLEKYLKNWMESQKKLLEEEEALQAHHQEMAYLKEAEVNPAHSFYSLPHRYTEFTVVKNSLQIAKKAAQEKLNECERWHNIHKVSMIAVTGGPELGRWCNEATKVIDFSISSFAPVIDFLRTAGQSQLLAQCEQADSELANLLHQHQSMLRSCLDTLNTYATVAIQYPASYLELNRCFKWQKWLLELQNNFTLSECHKIVGKFNSEFGMDRLSQTCLNTAQAVLTVEFQLQTLITNTNGRLLKLYERIRIENLDKVSLLVSNLDESKNAIYEFINACPKSGSMSLACVLLTALCSLNKRCLMMEGAAFAAGDRLVDLTSRDGDWFLDEVFSISSNVMQLLTLLRTNCQFIDDDIIKAIDGVAAVHRVIGSLEDLHLNFLTIILPEALKHIQSQERTVFQALQSLNSVINNVGYPLETLISQLELQMRSVVMEMDIPDAKATAIVEHIRNKFNSLVKDATNDNSNSGLSPGQMLFMGFDGLFTKLEQDFVEALDIMNRLVLPTCWRKVDLVKESKNLLAPVFLEPALVILRDIFFLKRLQAMQDFFTLSQHQARALLTILKEENDMQSYGAVYDDDHLTRPIKIFIADFVNKQLLGLLSQSLSYVVCLLVRVCGVNVTAEIELRDVGAENKVSLEELCRKAIDMSLKEDALKANQLSQASSLASAYENAWKKQDIARRLDQNILMLKSSLQRIQLQLASHQWLHEDILLPSNVLHNLATPTRASVMSEMRKTMQVLLAIESNLNVSRDRFVNLVSSVEQRLKWAVGANPSVTAILDEFEQSVTVKNDMISNFTKIGGEVTTTCSTILHCEALRTRTSEAISSDATFLQLINRCQESCLMAENCTMDVSSLEERLVEMKPLNGQLVTKEWILLVTEVVTNLTNEVQGQLAHRKVDMFCRWDCIKNQVMCIRSQLTTHHHLMSDVRVILKSMAKYEDQEPNCCVHGVKRYLQLYKSYSEKLSTFIREVLTEEMSIARAEELLADMRLLEQQTHDIYDELLQFAVTLTDDDSNDGNSTSNNNVLDPKVQNKEDGTLRSASSPRKHLSVLRSELFSGTSPSSQNVNKASGTLRKNTVTRDPRTGKAIQERNSYAVSVWRRVKMKLDGRDLENSRRSSVAEQVDFVLQEATNIDNLAVLYEGWTPWV